MYVPFTSVIKEEKKEESKSSNESELLNSENSEKFRSDISPEEGGKTPVLLPIPDGDDGVVVIVVAASGVIVMPDIMMIIVAKVNRVAEAMTLLFLLFLLLIDIV